MRGASLYRCGIDGRAVTTLSAQHKGVRQQTLLVAVFGRPGLLNAGERDAVSHLFPRPLRVVADEAIQGVGVNQPAPLDRQSQPDGRAPIGRTKDGDGPDRKSTRLNSSHLGISYAVFC